MYAYAQTGQTVLSISINIPLSAMTKAYSQKRGKNSKHFILVTMYLYQSIAKPEVMPDSWLKFMPENNTPKSPKSVSNIRQTADSNLAIISSYHSKVLYSPLHHKRRLPQTLLPILTIPDKNS